MNPALVALAALGLAGVIVLLISVRANARRSRSGRAMLRSIPEGIARAKKNKSHVLVLFLDPEDMTTPALLDLAFDAGLQRALAAFEKVRVDCPEDDLDVVRTIATKYGLASLEPPALLALDRDGRRIESLSGKKDVGAEPDELRERFVAFIERARARF